MTKLLFVLYIALFGWLLVILIRDLPIKRVTLSGECIDFTNHYDCDDPPKEYHTVRVL